ncbi:Protein CBG15934 [Caenorhabditis briggsae]|uniref:Protein CBG15934 n=1 Tax=Caenorhabditis briggsae TaxID=6238 RepID=A8XNG0_CAEBR|nr:Protein CBG15934 [Caenorhabditis briggsae]CAP34391.1 Protein CBG15934 [Caenorhabditis briggsae]
MPSKPKDTRMGVTPLRFHHIKGCHITLNPFRNIATRDQAEYSQGYVFTERPITNNEKVMIQVNQVQRLYEGGLAFGVTCCDPATVQVSSLPEDSSDLVEMPEYWVGIKDIALQPKPNSILSFWITDSGEVKFEMDSNGPRTVLHVDNSLKLYMYFDVYGSTLSIKLMGCIPVARSHSPMARSREGTSRNEQPLSIPTRPARMMDISSSSLFAPPALPARPPPAQHSPLRVNVRESSEPPVMVPAPVIDDLLFLDTVPRTPPPIVPRASTNLTASSSTSRLPNRPTTSAMPSFSPPPLPSSFTNLATAAGNDREGSGEPGEGDECTICMDAPVNSVLYTCGHMCCVPRPKVEGQILLSVTPDALRFYKAKNIIKKNPFVIDPAHAWISNLASDDETRKLRFGLRYKDDTLLMKLDDDTNWFTVLYFPTSVDYYNVRMTLCRTIRSVFIITKFDKNEPPKIYDPDFPKLYDSKKLTNDCSCGAVTV